MKRFVLSCVCAAVVLCAWTAAAQSPLGTVPQLLNFSGQVLTAGGAAKTGPALLTIALYDSQTGGTPLWSEQQAVTLDAQGRYAVILGALTQGGCRSMCSWPGARGGWASRWMPSRSNRASCCSAWPMR